MKEDFLHYVWRMRRFDHQDLRTTCGQSVEILQPGFLNADGGPDFNNARLRIGGVEWAGTVEMHLNASDWLAHGHQNDPAYDNVILHVVLNEDQTIYRKGKERIPCLELGHQIPTELLAKYQKLLVNEHWVPCQPFLPGLEQDRLGPWLERMAIERLETHHSAIAAHLKSAKGDWNAVFFRRLLRYFGGRVNNEACEQLAISLPWKILEKHHEDENALAALLFGQAGLLPETPQDEYPKLLLREYTFYKHKYNLEPIAAGVWKFLRMRPANFPTLRLAQFARLWSRNRQLLRTIVETDDLGRLLNQWSVSVHDYWLTHYQFDKEGPRKEKKLGKSTLNSIAINALIPFVFTYGKLQGNQQLQEKALDWLAQLPAESNAQINRWKTLGVVPKNALETQGLLHLKRNYCQQSKCLSCSIGHQILRRTQLV